MFRIIELLLVLLLLLMVLQMVRALVMPVRPPAASSPAVKPRPSLPARRSDPMPNAIKTTAFVLLVALLLGVTTGLLGAS